MRRPIFCDKMEYNRALRSIANAGNGGSDLHTQLFIASWNPIVTGEHLFAAIIVLASLLLVELIGLSVLLIKLARARRERKPAIHHA